MSARRLAWTLWVVAVGLAAIGLVLLAVTFDVPVPDSWGFRGFTAIFAFSLSTLGALLVGARGSRIGWLLLGAGVLSGIQGFCEEYAIFGLVAHPGTVPGPELLGWLNSWIWVFLVASVGIYVPLLFPTGRLLSPRWRVVAIATVVASVFLAFALALSDGPLNNAPFVRNPFGIPGFTAIDPITNTSGPAFLLGYGGLLTCALGALVSVIVRFRRARGIERQQMKSLVLGGVFLVIGFAAGGGLQEQGKLGQVFFIATIQIVPLSVAIAILRYRLYDIDLLINRTVVYGLTTAAIGVSFFLLIVVLQAPLRAVTGGSELAVAASTLACFALFTPLRRRIQRTVDRRFYRARYDAARTLDRFAGRIAGEVELAALRRDLVEALEATVQPAQLSIWLREARP